MALANDAPQQQATVQIIMPGQSDRERLTRVETEVDTMQANIQEIRADVKTVIATLNQLTGGKKALIAITSVAGAIIGIVISLLTGLHKFFGH